MLAALSRIIISLNLSSTDEFFNEILQIIFTNIPLKSDGFENATIVKLCFYIAQKVDIKPIFNSIMETFRYVVLNEVSCGTTKELIKEIKVFLEVLNSKNELKQMMEAFIENIPTVEKERFISTIKNC